jgi:hypothetical protein
MAQGLSQAEVYKLAGGKAKTTRAAEVLASRFLQRPDVQHRLAEIGRPATKKAEIDTEHYLRRFDRIYEGAIQDAEYGHATRANELSAKMTGHLIDRAEIKASVEFSELSSVEDVLDAMLQDFGDGDLDTALAFLDGMRARLIERAGNRARIVSGATAD